MTSEDSKVPTGEPEGNEPEGWTIGGRATPDEIHLIDQAAAIARMRRGPWMIQVCVGQAQQVIEANARQVLGASQAA